MQLTVPRPGNDSLRALMPRVLTRIAQQYLALPAGPAGSLRHQAAHHARTLVARDPAMLASILAQPTVTALLGTCLHDGERSDPSVRHLLDLTVLVDAAVRDPMFSPVEIARPEGGWPATPILSIAQRASLRIDPHRPSLTLSAGVLPSDAGTLVENAFVPLVGGMLFALADGNPLAHVSLHPERAGNAFDLGNRPVDQWVDALRDAFALIERHLPEVFAEMQWFLRTVVPVGYLPERHASCSYEDALGSIYLTLHPSAVKLAEALVHEFQHNKLHALMRLDPVLLNARTSRHRSPVRPDPRPLEGVLLAVHAFIPVALMYRRMTEAGDVHTRSRDWEKTRAGANAIYRDGAETLFAHGIATPTGRLLLDDMRTWIAELGDG